MTSWMKKFGLASCFQPTCLYLEITSRTLTCDLNIRAACIDPLTKYEVQFFGGMYNVYKLCYRDFSFHETGNASQSCQQALLQLRSKLITISAYDMKFNPSIL